MTRPGRDLHSFLEGPSFAADGSLMLVDVPHGRILRIDPSLSRWDVLYTYDGEPHAVLQEPDGTLVLTDYRRGLLRLDLRSGALSTLCDGYGGEAFRGLSDLAADPDGSIWFTDSGRTSLTDPRGRLFRRDANGQLDCVLDNVPYPNGIAFSADNAFAFVAATRANAVWRIARQWSGTAQPMAGTYLQLSGGLGPDGLAVSPDGYLAVAHAQAGRAWLFDPVGDPIACILTPGGGWTTAVRFSSDGRTLFIVEAEAGALFAVGLSEMGIA
jgi:gluconolactonase